MYCTCTQANGTGCSNMNFPQPRKIGHATLWRLHDLQRYEALCSGEAEPAEPLPESERFLTVKQVAARYGKSPVTIWRWAQASRTAA